MNKQLSDGHLGDSGLLAQKAVAEEYSLDQGLVYSLLHPTDIRRVQETPPK